MGAQSMMNNDNSITVLTKLYGYIAENAHSSRFSVTLNKLYKESGMDAMMIPMNIRSDDVAFTISQMRSSKLNGAVIASEYQEEALGLVDEASATAQENGYCDCIMIREGRLIGDLITMRALESYADHLDFPDEIAMRSMCHYFYDLTTGEKR
jgi:shikimate 5-dehydrogenase